MRETPGRLHHSSFGPADHLMVYDVWESEGAFTAFGEALMPILAEIGLDVGAPEIMQVHNIIGEGDAVLVRNPRDELHPD